MPLTTGNVRRGALLKLVNDHGSEGWGEASPLPGWSRETLEECISQLKEKTPEILSIDWTSENCLQCIKNLNLLPALSFAVESAMLSLVSPLIAPKVKRSALFMGSVEEIREQSRQRYAEGYRTAKLKVSQLSFEEALELILSLKTHFRLRIDVNRSWETEASLKFFSEFPLNTFDYVEEPFQNPQDLVRFPHPLAVDESYPNNLSLSDLERLPTLSTLIYKPTLQGGLAYLKPLHSWALSKGIDLILSASFESRMGLSHIESMAHRLRLPGPHGLGTLHFVYTSDLLFS